MQHADLVALRHEDERCLGVDALRQLAGAAPEDEEAREVVRVVLDPVIEHLQPVHLGRARGGHRCRVAKPLLAHKLRGAGGVVRGHGRDAQAAQVPVRLRERLRVRHCLLDVLLLDAGQREERVAHAERVLAEDVHLAVVAQHEVVVDVDRSTQRVLHRHRDVIDRARHERGEYLLE